MAQLNYFRGQTSGGVPAGLGQATNTGMAVGISKGMDALARGLEKFFQNKREKAEEDAYAELLKKLNEMPDTRDATAEEAAAGTPGLPDFLDTGMEKSEFIGPMEATPESVAALQKAQANPDDLPQVITQEMSYNPDIEGMMFDPATNQYYPHATDTMITGKGTGQFHITDDGRYVKGPTLKHRSFLRLRACKDLPLSIVQRKQQWQDSRCHYHLLNRIKCVTNSLLTMQVALVRIGLRS